MSYNPYRHLGALRHITFGITRLPAGRGWWLPHRQAIVLDDRLTAAQRRCTLAHELVHAEEGHEQVACVGPGTDRIARRRERHADRTAACRLITLDQLVDGLRWTLDDDELADYLAVDVETVRARRNALTPTEQAQVEVLLDDEVRDIA